MQMSKPPSTYNSCRNASNVSPALRTIPAMV